MGRKEVIGISAIIVLILGVAIFTAFRNQEEKIEYREEAITFKDEYETYNDQVNESNGKTYAKLDISKENPIYYLKDSEVVEKMKTQDGVYYFGFPTCPWCRALVPVLMDAMESMDLKTLYYTNILDIRSTYSLENDRKAIVTKNGSEGYYEILDFMDSVLGDYVLTTSKNREVKTGEKRLYAPTLVFIKDGAMVGYHEGTVASHNADPYLKLTEAEYEELYNIMIANLQLVGDCDKGC